MTAQTPRTRTSRTRARARRLGALAVAFSGLLSPTGKTIVGAVAAAVLLGGVALQLRAPSSSSTQAFQPGVHPSFRLAHVNPSATDTTHIESDGEVMSIVLVEGAPVKNGSGAPTSIPGSTLSGLSDGDPSGPSPQGGLPPLRPVHNMYPPGFSRPVGHPPSPTNTPQGTPPGSMAPSGRGAGPQNSGPPNTPPTNSPAGSSTAAGRDASPEEAGAPAAPQSEPQTDPGPDEKSASPHAPDLMRQPGTSDPFNPLFPISAMGPLRTTDQPLPQILPLSRAAIPEPSMLGLMLIGFAALAWKARRRPSFEKDLDLDARCLLVGVVAGSHHRATGRMLESHRQRLLLELSKAFGCHKSQHRQVMLRGL